MRALRHLLISLVLVVGVVACSGQNEPQAEGPPTVHASGPVWASVARAVAGDLATVTSTEMSASQDPHSYEPSAQDKLAFQKADVIVINGGHYDEWAEELVRSLDKGAVVVNAMELADDVHEHESEEPSASGGPSASGSASVEHDHEGHDHEGHDHENEHVFQSIPTAEVVAAKLTERLALVDPKNAETYRSNATSFGTQIHEELAAAQKTLAPHRGAKVLATEAVASLLIADLGLTDVTPAAYVEQSETDDGPSVAVLAEAEKLVRSGEVKLLLVNAQTGDNASARLEKAARESGVPVVQVHETLPDGVTTYAAYMQVHIDAIVKALT